MVYTINRLRIGVWSLLALAGIAVVFYLAAPHLINSRPFKARLLAPIHNIVDGAVDYDEVVLTLWPSPHVMVTKGRIHWGTHASVELEALVVHPRIPALLRGHLEVAGATLIAPKAVIRLDGDASENAPTVPMGALVGHFASIMAVSGSLRLENGQMDLLGPEGPLLRLNDLDIESTADANEVMVTARGNADGIDGLQITARIPRPNRDDRPHDVAGHEGPPPFALTVHADQSDVASLGRMAASGYLYFLPPAVTHVLQGGTIKGFTLQATGMSLARLSDFSAMHITGTLSDGAIHVPGIMLDLEGVSADVAIVEGKLTADALDAELGATTGRGGTLTMGLLNTPLTMDLAIELDADLAQLPTVLRRALDHPQVHDELEGIRNLAGRAIGNLYVNGRVTDLAVKAIIQDFELNARHVRFPDRLRIHQGKLRYTDRHLRIEDAGGAIHNSTFENLTVDLRWSGEPRFDLETVAARIEAETALAWTAPLMATLPYADTLQGVTGWLDLTDARLSGPLLDPSQWRLNAAGCLETITVLSSELPGPLHLVEGCIHIHDTHLGLSQIRLDLRDAHLYGTATIPLRGEETASLSLGGVVGTEMVEWLQAAFQVPEPLAAVGPITGLEMHIARPQAKTIRAEVRFDLSDRLALVADMQIDDGRLRLEELSVSDRTSDARLTGIASWADNHLEWDLALTSEVLDVNTIPSIFRASKGKAPSQPERFRQRTLAAMAGRITISIDSLVYGDLRLKAIRGTFRVDGDRATLAVTEADLCGISTVGQVDWHPDGVSLRLRPKTQDQPLRYIAGCFSGAPATERLEGTLAVEGALTADGAGIEALRTALRGEVALGVTDGRVYNIGEAGLLTNILSFLKINNLVRGDLPNMRERDFKYDRMHLRTRVDGSMMVIEEAELISNALNMVGEGHVDLQSGQLDLTLLVSPLTTVDAIIRHIPIVGRILQGTLVAIPVGVRGPLSNPRVLPLAPRAVGARLVGILERTLQTPFHVIGPILPQGSDRNNGENQPRSSD